VLEKNKEQRKHDVEETLNRIQEEMSKYVTSYNHNMEVLNSIYEGAMNLLRNVSIAESDASEQTSVTSYVDMCWTSLILSTGTLVIRTFAINGHHARKVPTRRK
jgi:hypothetical protein